MVSPAARLILHPSTHQKGKIVVPQNSRLPVIMMTRLVFSSSFPLPAIFGRASTSSQAVQSRKFASGAGKSSEVDEHHSSVPQAGGSDTPFAQMWEHHKPSYRPGTDTYAYDNPWPKINKGRLDWLFQDGWRRPLAKDQGAKLRREWIPYGWDVHDEYNDWLEWHKWNFWALSITLVWMSAFCYCMLPDRIIGERDWAQREAFMELARREAEGLSLIGKDYIPPTQVALSLPSDEELGNTPIII